MSSILYGCLYMCISLKYGEMYAFTVLYVQYEKHLFPLTWKLRPQQLKQYQCAEGQ